MRYRGRTAIVTGGGSGIGAAIARRLAGEGAAVAVVDVHDARARAVAGEIERAGGRADAFACDVSDPAGAPALFTSVEEALGPVDALFNNAGIAVVGDAVEHSTEDFRRVMAVNVDAVWFLSREFVTRCRALERTGAIVNTASVNAWFVEPRYAAYCASKGAVVALTKAMALDHAGEGIRINCICPGWTETSMTTPVFDAHPDPELARREAGATHALGRIAGSDEIAAAAVFLASDDASFFCGSAVVVDGGMTLGAAVGPAA